MDQSLTSTISTMVSPATSNTISKLPVTSSAESLTNVYSIIMDDGMQLAVIMVFRIVGCFGKHLHVPYLNHTLTSLNLRLELCSMLMPLMCKSVPIILKIIPPYMYIYMQLDIAYNVHVCATTFTDWKLVSHKLVKDVKYLEVQYMYMYVYL